jgi:hypothetical protein
MNYIRHLTAFFDRVEADDGLNSSHISLYMALFQFWNLNHFENPLSINRNQVMRLSKIGSEHTYHKCLHELDKCGYIKYIPSHNPMKGSLVHLCSFDTSTAQALHNPRGKNDTSTAQALPPSLNVLNVINNKTLSEENLLNDKKYRNRFSPPGLAMVKSFFQAEKFPAIEAEKFFNHFQSNGWKVGGKSPMKDWQAAARNWILNSGRYSTKQSADKPHTLNKDYSEPL